MTFSTTSMSYNFDTIINRSGTGSLKWNRFGPDVLPLWVADMDFACAPEVLEALRDRVDHGVMGYTVAPREAEDAALAYLDRVHGYKAEREWLVWMHGMVPGLNIAARAYATKGEEVLTCTPVYPPFLGAPDWQDRVSITSHLEWDGNRWTFDFADLEQKVTDQTKLFYLCSPHNPVGRVYDKQELSRIAHFCLKHKLVLLSDEIHCDLILDDASHTCTATLSPEIEDATVTFMAPSKTYNVPGLSCAFAIIKDATLRGKFKLAARGLITEINPFGYTGLIASYNKAEPWRKELISYLRNNRDYLYSFIGKEMPEITLNPMEATYLAWLNVEGIKALGIDNPQTFFIEHGVGLSPGKDFGDDNYLRLNFGCPRSVLEDALSRMAKAVQSLR